MNAKYRLLKNIALPSEHGIWTFWATPALIGTAVFPSVSGFLLSLAGLAAILLENPVNLYATDKRRDKYYPRTRIARNTFLLYATVLAITTALAVYYAGPNFLLVFLGALPFALYQIYFKIQNKARRLLVEFAGVVAISSLASAIAIAGHASYISAVILWLAVVAWGFPAVVYVRTKVLYSHGEKVLRWPAMLFALLSLVLVIALSILAYLPAVLILAFIVLLLRSVLGLGFMEFMLEPKQIGILEMVLALILSLTFIISYKKMLISL